MRYLFKIVVATVLISFVQAGSKHDGGDPDTYCPLPQSKIMVEFDIQKFVGDWYVQKAQDSMMTPATQMNCIRQRWSILDSNSNLGMDYETRETSAFGNHLAMPGYNASVFNPNEPGKISLGLTPNVAASISAQPFWIVGTDSTTEVSYSWVIVINGLPTYESGKNGDRLCSTNGATSGGDIKDVGRGMWYMTRVQDGSAFIAAMDAFARRSGIDPGVLNPVTQTGCVYDTPVIPVDATTSE